MVQKRLDGARRTSWLRPKCEDLDSGIEGELIEVQHGSDRPSGRI
jgi:hypothetical protein